MTRTRKRETGAAERDERIVAEAGPWKLDFQGCRVWADGILNVSARHDPHAALVRIANRLARARRKAK